MARPNGHTRWLLGGILLFSACYLVWFSHIKAFWGDESLTYYTVHNRTFSELMKFQASTPIVLEPPANDVLLWAAVHLLGYTKWALRLPSILLFLLLQVLLYRLTALIGGLRAGLIAAALLITTQFVSYGAEARPYALLATLTIASLILWHAAHQGRGFRELVLLALTFTLAVAVLTQFYGALIFFPLVIAELVWCCQQRRPPDIGIALSLIAGFLAILLVLPFLHAVKPYAPLHVNRSIVSWAQFAATYEWGFRPEPGVLRRLHLGYTGFIMSLLILCAAGGFPRRGEPQASTSGDVTTLPLRRSLWAALLALMVYPLPALLIAYLITHVYSPRHSVQCVLGLVALLSVSLGQCVRRLRGPWLGVAAAVLTVYVVQKCREHLHDQTAFSQKLEEHYPISAPVQAWLAAHPSSPVYLTIDECLLYPFYGNPAYSRRIRCLGSVALEAKYEGSLVSSLTEQVMMQHTDLPYEGATYGDLQQAHHFLLAYNSQPWLIWIPSALADDGARSVALGTGFGGTVSLVSLP